MSLLSRQIAKERQELAALEERKQSDPFWDGQAHFTRDEILSFEFLGEAYTPYDKQQDAHELKIHTKGVVAGYGAGKTSWLAAEGLKMAYLNPGYYCGIISPSYRMAKRTIIRTLVGMLDTAGIPYEYNKTDYLFTLPIDGQKAYIEIMSGDDPASCKGPNLVWLGVDEPFIIKQTIWDIALSRVRIASGYYGIALAGTPEDLNWGYTLLVDERDDDTALFQMSTRDNPHLPEWYIERLLNQYDEVTARAYIEGEFIPLVKGRSYHAFTTANVIPDAHAGAQYHPKYPLCLAFDFNVNPYCVAIGQQFGKYAVVMDEIKTYQADTEYVAKEIIRKVPIRSFKEIRIYGDASGNFRSTKSVLTDYDILRDVFSSFNVDFRVPHSNPSVADRVQLVNMLFRNAAGHKRLFVAHRAKHVRNDFLRVKWREGKREIDKSNPELTHFSDAVGYWLDYEFGMELVRRAA